MQTVTYWRKPTQAEIKFGHGAIHYREFYPSEYVGKNGQVKKWLKSYSDGLRYYRY